MLRAGRIARALAIAMLLTSTLGAPAFAAKASDPEPQVVCFKIFGQVVCVPVS